MFTVFEQLPYELKLSVFQEMDMVSIGRMRQTGKKVNAIIENNRFRIKARSSEAPAILKISLDGDKMALTTKVAFKQVPKEELSQLSYTLELLSDEDYILIEKPIKQLSACKFDYVFFDFNYQVNGGRAYEIRQNMAAQAAAFEEVFPLLDGLRLDCEWLCLKAINFNNEKIKDILSRIRCQKLFFNGYCTSSDLLNWPIQNCKELHMGMLTDVPKNISLLSRNLRNGFFAFEAEDGIEDMIRDFIMEIKKDSSARGCLQKLAFFSIGMNFLEKTEGLDVIWEDETICGDAMTIYKMSIEGGVIYIKFWQDSYELEFLQDERDEEITKQYTSCHCRYPCND